MKKLLSLVLVLSFIAVVPAVMPRAASAFTMIPNPLWCVIDPALVGQITPYNDTSMKGYQSDGLTGAASVRFDDLVGGSAEALLPGCMEGALNSAIQVNNELKKNGQALNFKVVEYDGVQTILGISAGVEIPQF